MLGERERQVLEQTERRLRQDDPAWVDAFDTAWAVVGSQKARAPTIAVVAVVLILLGCLLSGLGLLAVVAGALLLPSAWHHQRTPLPPAPRIRR